MVLIQEKLDSAHKNAINRFELVRNIPRISALTDLFEATYEITSYEDKVPELIGDCQIRLGPGAFYGDEGKGKFGNRMASDCDLVVRLRGGENTGRSFIDPTTGEKVVLHAVPSAVPHGVKCLMNSEMVIDPINITNREFRPLQDRGYTLDNLMIGNCHIVTPAHKIMDVLGSPNNSSTGVGMKASHESKARKTSARLNDLVNSRSNLIKRLQKDMLAYTGFIAATPHIQDENHLYQQLVDKREKNPRVVPDHVLHFAYVHKENGLEKAIEDLADSYIDLLRDSDSPLNNRVVAREVMQKALAEDKNLYIEPTQGHFLNNDNEVGYRQGTSVNSSASGALSSQGIDLSKYKPFVVSIQKTPGTSRVGAGDVPFAFCGSNVLCEAGATNLKDLGEIICQDFQEIHTQYFENILENGIAEPFIYDDKTGSYDGGVAMAITTSRFLNEKGATTNKPRITGWFDCVAAAEVVRAQGEYMFISAMDRGLIVGYTVAIPEASSDEFSRDEEGNFMFCNGTKYRTGDIIEIGDSVPNSHVLGYCVPIVKVMQGWSETPLYSKNPEAWHGKNLPTSTSNFIATIEGLTGAHVLGIGVGPDDHEALYLKKQ
mgnify:FL=1